MKKFMLLLFLTITIIVSGCHNPESIKKNFISGSNHKLWQKTRDTSMQKGFSTFLYYFDREGRWKVYEKQASDQKIVKANFGDIQNLEKWHLIDTSHVNVNGNDYKIEVLNDSIFSYKNPLTGIKFRLIYKNDILPQELKPK
jgi:hypothetical protein